MANQPPKTVSPELGDDELTADDCEWSSFEWTTKPEKSLLFNMIRLKPSGINKHLSMLLLREKISDELKLNIPTKCIWNYLETKWDISSADVIENTSFNTSDKDFILPEEFDLLISEEGDKIQKVQDKECLNDEMMKRKLFSGRGITRSKSNSMSSIDSKDGLNETVPSTPSDSSFVKTNEIGTEEGPGTRRSLRTNDKPEEKEPEEDSLNKKKNITSK